MTPHANRSRLKFLAILLAFGLSLSALSASSVEAASITTVVIVPVVAVFQDARSTQGEVLPAVTVQVERRDDQEPLRLVLKHRPGMVDASYPERLGSALRTGLARLGHDLKGLTVMIGFAGPFQFNGGSLSAAVVIGAVAALEGRLLAPNLVLTGTVEPDGSLGAISDLDAKIAGAGSYTVLYPSSQSTTENRHARPIRTLQEARVLMIQ